MKKFWILIIVLIAVVALSLFLFQTFGGDELSFQHEKNENIINIGVFEPFTGINSPGGYQEKLGLMYANELKPTVDLDGETYYINLIYSDNKSEVQAATKAAQKLVDGNVSAVLGSYGSSVSLAGADIFEKAEIPAIGISCTNPDITLNYKCYYRVCFLDSFQGQVMANFAYSQGFRKSAVITQVGDAYSKGLGEYFSEGFEDLGGSTKQFNFNSATKNFSELIAELEASDSDFIYMPSPVETAVLFITQMRESSPLPIYGGDTWDMSKLISGTGKSGRNVFFTSQFDENAEIEFSGAEFVSEFQTWLEAQDSRLILNGENISVAPVSALAFDAYNILIKAVEVADSIEPKDIMAALSGLRHDGVCGTVAFDKNGDSGKANAYIKTIDVVEEKFVTIQESNALVK